MTFDEILKRQEEIEKEIEKKANEIESLNDEIKSLRCKGVKTLYNEMVKKNPEMWWKYTFSSNKEFYDYIHITGISKSVNDYIFGGEYLVYNVDKRVSFNERPYLKITVDLAKNQTENANESQLSIASKEEIVEAMKKYHEEQLKEFEN